MAVLVWRHGIRAECGGAAGGVQTEETDGEATGGAEGGGGAPKNSLLKGPDGNRGALCSSLRQSDCQTDEGTAARTPRQASRVQGGCG